DARRLCHARLQALPQSDARSSGPHRPESIHAGSVLPAFRPRRVPSRGSVFLGIPPIHVALRCSRDSAKPAPLPLARIERFAPNPSRTHRATLSPQHFGQAWNRGPDTPLPFRRSPAESQFRIARAFSRSWVGGYLTLNQWMITALAPSRAASTL